MPEFEVVLERSQRYFYTIEASCAEEAKEKAATLTPFEPAYDEAAWGAEEAVATVVSIEERIIPDEWVCPGCGTTTMDVRRHVEDCDLVNGAGQRLKPSLTA